MPAPDVSKDPRAVVRASPAPPTILVVDDDKAVLHTMTMLLEVRGYRVITATDGVEGLRKFREHRPDLMLSDIIMPEKDGIDLIVELRRDYPDAKIVAMSGGGRMGNMDFITIATSLGADAGIMKPFDSDQLVATLQSVLELRAA